jgi:hypothetical protein
VQDSFLKGKSDEERFELFTNNLLLWEKDIGDEVRAWVEENWGRWKEERPPWFKAEMVPERVVPAVEQEARKSLIGGGGV